MILMNNTTSACVYISQIWFRLCAKKNVLKDVFEPKRNNEQEE